MAKSPIRWVGGKSRLLKTLRAYLPADHASLRHVEPFAGSAALFFDLEPDRAWLGDLCEPLIRCYGGIQLDHGAVLRSLQALQRYQTREDFARIRARFNARTNDCPAYAAEFLYLNAVGFNGIYRENAAGLFNAPFGEWPRAGVYRRATIERAAQLLQPARLQCCNAIDAYHSIGPGDFVYIDPPYLPIKEGSFRGYNADRFRLRQHAQLVAQAERWAESGAKVMLSNADTWAARELLIGWQIHSVETRTSVGATAARRGTQAEIIATSYGVSRKDSHARSGKRGAQPGAIRRGNPSEA